MDKAGYEQDNSRVLYSMRGLAIYFVIAAHCTYIGEVPQTLTSILGLIGVPVLFWLSGYFLDTEGSRSGFWIKKLKNIVIPWIVWGVLTYILHVISDKEFSAVALFKWIGGFYTWLYYIPVLLVLFLMYRIIGKKRIFVLISVLLSVVTHYLTVFRVLEFSFITPYQNVLNWALFFAIGLLIRQTGGLQKIIYSKLTFLISSVLFTALFVLFFLLDIEPYYWSVISLPFELSGIGVMLGVANLLKKSRFLQNIARSTVVIYYLHMQVGITAVNYCLGLIPYHLESIAFALVLPAIVLLFTYGLIFLMTWFLKKLKQNWALNILGLKKWT